MATLLLSVLIETCREPALISPVHIGYFDEPQTMEDLPPPHYTRKDLLEDSVKGQRRPWQVHIPRDIRMNTLHDNMHQRRNANSYDGEVERKLLSLIRVG